MLSLVIYPVTAILPLVYLLVTYLMHHVKNRRELDVQAYPPTGESAILTEKIAGKKITGRGLVAAILELCEEGHIKIKKNNKSIDLLKISDYEGVNRYKKQIMSNLFEGAKDYYGADDAIMAYPLLHLSKDALSRERLKDILKQINSDYKNRRIRGHFKKADTAWKIISAVMLLMIVIVNRNTVDVEMLGVLFFIPFLYAGIYLFTDGIERLDTFVIIFASIWSLAVTKMLLAMMTVTGKIEFIFGIVMIVLSYYINMMRGSSFSFQSENKSLRQFLAMINGSAKTKEMNRHYSELNPNRFYEVLPYVSALGKQEKWIKQHKDIKVEKPDWIITEEEYDLDTISECVEQLSLSVK